MSCRVKNCRHNTDHTTQRHMCGKCHHLGHGVVECGNTMAISKLSDNSHMYLNKPYTGTHIDYHRYDIGRSNLNCTALQCYERDTHNIDSHQKIFENFRNYVD
jgi:hypothetical protein